MQELNRISYETSLKLFVVLNKAHKAVIEHATKDIKKHGMSLSQFSILELLFHRDKIAMQQIAEKVLITSGSITYNIDKLESKGLLVREYCPTDRRVTYAVITEQGKAMFAQIMDAHALVIQDACVGIDEQEMQEAIMLLKKLGKEAKSRLT
jgi:MarR family 2-MHQ and catechol resistance regulon transcriptional repressor